MHARRAAPLALVLCALAAAACAGASPGGDPAAAPPSAAPSAASDPTLGTWVSGWFAWGEGEVKVEKSARTIPGWRASAVTKSYKVAQEFQDRADVLVSDDGKTAIIGSLFYDEERAAAPAPVAIDADLASLKTLLRTRVLSQIRSKVALDPARDLPGWKGLAIGVETGYGAWTLPAYVSAADGALLVLGRAWRRDRGIAEQRREIIDLAGTPAQGPEGAKVSLVEYSDMQCPMCKKRSGDLAALLDRLKGELAVRRYMKSYPLTEIHPWSFRAASASRCFWGKDPASYAAFKSNVYARQEQLDVQGLDALVVDFAAAHGGLEELGKCYLQTANDEKILKDLGEGFSVGVRSTPTFVVDGVLVVWFDEPFMEEYLRKTYLGGKGLPIRTPAPPAVKPAQKP